MGFKLESLKFFSERAPLPFVNCKENRCWIERDHSTATPISPAAHPPLHSSQTSPLRKRLPGDLTQGGWNGSRHEAWTIVAELLPGVNVQFYLPFQHFMEAWTLYHGLCPSMFWLLVLLSSPPVFPTFPSAVATRPSCWCWGVSGSSHPWGLCLAHSLVSFRFCSNIIFLKRSPSLWSQALSLLALLICFFMESNVSEVTFYLCTVASLDIRM